VIIAANRNRNKQIIFMVTEQERALIEEKMKLANIRNMRAYLLKMAVDGYVVRLDLSDIRDMVSLLRNATNNLNQIARRANETRNIYEADIKDLQAYYDRLWEQAEGIMKKLAEI
jgi:protein-tyrosine-phosphatase